MAYNVFKRPMFKRGGSTQGTGIMSHVEPRVKAADGFFGSLMKPATNPDGTPVMIPQRSFADDASFLIGPGKFVKAGGAGLNILKQAGQFAKFPKGYPSRGAAGEGIEYLKYADKPGLFTNRGILEAIKPYTTGASETLKAAGRGIKDFGKEYGIALGIGIPAAGTAAYNLFKDDEEKIREAMTGDPAQFSGEDELTDFKSISEGLDIPGPDKKKPGAETGGEPTFEDTYEKEKKRIEKLLGDDDSKGMAAIALSKAIGTPGTIADKAAALNDQLLGLMKGKKAEKRDIAKLAYTATKEIEKAKIMANKEGYSEKMANEIRRYQTTLRNPDASETDKNFARQQLSILKDTVNILNPKAREGLTSTDTTLLNALEKAADKVKRLSKDPTSTAYKNALDDYNLTRVAVSKNPDLLDYIALADSQIRTAQGLKDGGRVNRAMGTPEMGETPTTPVQKLSFAELRNRLPREITDDVITLLSNSEEALQDFAYIKTQGDVNKFNMKYGVNAVLPAQS